MWVAVVRHGHAGQRSDFDGPDLLRPLSTRGHTEAAGLARDLSTSGASRIISSPAVRCIETLLPLSRALGVDVESDPRLFEGTEAEGVLEVISELGATPAVLCTHGDVIPALLDDLRRNGVELTSMPTWPKASTWVLEGTDLAIELARYVPPPT